MLPLETNWTIGSERVGSQRNSGTLDIGKHFVIYSYRSDSLFYVLFLHFLLLSQCYRCFTLFSILRWIKVVVSNFSFQDTQQISQRIPKLSFWRISTTLNSPQNSQPLLTLSLLCREGGYGHGGETHSRHVPYSFRCTCRGNRNCTETSTIIPNFRSRTNTFQQNLVVRVLFYLIPCEKFSDITVWRFPWGFHVTSDQNSSVSLIKWWY